MGIDFPQVQQLLSFKLGQMFLKTGKRALCFYIIMKSLCKDHISDD